jgi:hypothetical protein
MRAAAAGNSTIGIPKKVGAEYSAADKGGKLPEKKKKAVDRSAHYPGNPGFPSSSEAGGSPPPATYQTHEAREKEVMGAGYEQHEAAEHKGFSKTPHSFSMPKTPGAHGFGHSSSQHDGHHRLSGAKGAHRIGKK